MHTPLKGVHKLKGERAWLKHVMGSFFFGLDTKWKGGQPILMKIEYVVLIGDLGKRVFYFCDFRPLRGLTGVTKFRDFGKFALDQDTFDGYNFFISRDNGIIPIVLER